MKELCLNKAIAVVLVLSAMVLANPMRATDMSESLSTCMADNCAARRIDGSVTAWGSIPYMWVGEVFAPVDRCLRLEVTSEGADLEMTVVSPSGLVFQVDDAGGDCDFGLCPRVEIAETDTTGLYTVMLHSYFGGAIETSFSLFYGLYNVGNPNCDNPTPFLNRPDEPKPPKP